MVKYRYADDIRDNDELRNSFISLAGTVFGLDFEPWYRKGYWGDGYIPHILMDGQTVVSNISVNIIDVKVDGRDKRYIQLGTVMTAPKYRGRGLGRWLMEKVLAKWRGQCDCIYLFANDSVMDFYPKFGFGKATQYQCRQYFSKAGGGARKLNMSVEADVQILLSHYRLSNPYSRLAMENNVGLLMFYCSQFLQDQIYYLEAFDTVLIVEYEDHRMVCYDIFSDGLYALDKVIGEMVLEEQTEAVLGFAPKCVDGWSVEEWIEEDTTLFVLEGKENVFLTDRLMFPLLSHA